jgi:hypothetical protein
LPAGIATMTGHEKYEPEKERKEAVGTAAANRKAVEEHEAAAKSFQAQAQRTRDFADLLRKL